jgi:hypothetical protein
VVAPTLAAHAAGGEKAKCHPITRHYALDITSYFRYNTGPFVAQHCGEPTPSQVAESEV